MAAHRLEVVDYCRGIAALLVAFFHYDVFALSILGSSAFFGMFSGGHAGVEFFFVLSGFVILRGHRHLGSSPAEISRFYWNRAARLYPLLWIVLSAILVVALVLPGRGKDISWNLFDLARDFFLVPRDGLPMLRPTWTLHHEMIFYIIFGFYLLHRSLGVAVLVFWQALCLSNFFVSWMPLDYTQPQQKLMGYLNLGFGIGMLVAIVEARLHDDRIAHAAGWLGVSCVFAMMFGEAIGYRLPYSYPMLHSTAYLVAFGGIVLSAARLRAGGPVGLQRLLAQLGAASYALYLIHEPVASVFFRAARPLALQGWPAPLLGLIGIFGAVLLAIAIHRIVEKPAMRLFRALGRRSDGESTQAERRAAP